MWHTPDGDRVLKGAEARLIRASLESLICIVEDDDGSSDDHRLVYVPLFDELEKPQKIVLLARIVRALFREDVRPPRPTAVVDATVYALFQNVVNEIEHEIAFHPSKTRWRRRTLEACREAGLSDTDEDADGDWLPAQGCTDVDAWNDVAQSLAEMVTPDQDWRLADEMLDRPPVVVNKVKRDLGIEEDYFTAVVRIPTAVQVAKARKTLEAITRRRPR
jgi:hypothetical protein